MNNGRDCKHGRQVGKCDSCELELAEKQITELEAERDALAAQVHAIKSAWVAIGNWPDTVEDKKLIANAICAASDQCLAEIRAKAVNDFIEFMYKSADCNLCEKSLDVAVSYAEKIRQGEVK